MPSPPPPKPRQRARVQPPTSRVPEPPKPRFSASEAPTRPATNENAARWRMIARAVAELDAEGLEILEQVGAALAPLEPPDLLLRYDAVDERRKRVIAAVVHALAATEP